MDAEMSDKGHVAHMGDLHIRVELTSPTDDLAIIRLRQTRARVVLP